VLNKAVQIEQIEPIQTARRNFKKSDPAPIPAKSHPGSVPASLTQHPDKGNLVDLTA
jgi:hypothetical protein